MEVMKCEHERAVHLFVDSLMNKDHMSFAFQCTGPDRFKKGICLSCRKNRCNNIGYNTRKMRKRRNTKMYLKTRADTPFGGELKQGFYYYYLLVRVKLISGCDNLSLTSLLKCFMIQRLSMYSSTVNETLTLLWYCLWRLPLPDEDARVQQETGRWCRSHLQCQVIRSPQWHTKHLCGRVSTKSKNLVTSPCTHFTDTEMSTDGWDINLELNLDGTDLFKVQVV